MKPPTLAVMGGVVKLVYAAPSMDLTSFGMLPPDTFEVADLTPSALASSTYEWKVGDACFVGKVGTSDPSPSIHWR